MGFSRTVREDVLVRSARRCCLCGRFKGLGIEIHHIIAAAAGGDDTLGNAIALCYDCHHDAGHYNDDHPRGSKFSPNELRRHRDRHWANVAAGHIAEPTSTAAAGLHIRHLVCLDYEDARAALAGGFRNDFLNIDRVVQTRTGTFMEKVLADDLPPGQGSLVRLGLATPGLISIDGYWPRREDLVGEHPEFEASDTSPLEMRHLEDGTVQSRLLKSCVEAGLAPADLGLLVVHHNMCGEEGWFIECQIRRPLFVFTLVENLGAAALEVVAIRGHNDDPGGIAPRQIGAYDSDALDQLSSPPILLQPGEGFTLPAAVVLSPADEDDLAFEWVDNVPSESPDMIRFIGHAAERARRGDEAYLKVGPSFDIAGLEVIAQGDQSFIQGRELDLRRVYLLGSGWLAGSCPYAVVELISAEKVVLGEILVRAWNHDGREVMQMPAGARRLQVCEVEFETTILRSILVSGQESLAEPLVLRRGESVTIPVQGGDIVTITGRYECAQNAPVTSEQLRSKRSLVAGGLRALVGQSAPVEAENYGDTI